MGRMDQIQVLTAVSEPEWDARLMRALASAPGRLVVARRCVDLSDLLGAAGAGLGQAVLLSADLRRLDREAVSTLRRSKVAVIGVLPSQNPESARERFGGIGVRHQVPVDAPPAGVAEVIHEAITEADSDPLPDGVPRFGTVEKAGIEDAVRAGGALRPGGDEPNALDFVEGGGQQGRVIAVWGPCGAPGRTTLAVNIAMEAALLGQSTVLADADTYGASVAQSLGLLDEAPGLAGAARVANNGHLDPISLARYARRVTPNLHVLTGVTRQARWTELRPSALEAVLRLTRSVAAVTVVDCGFCLEEDEILSYDTEAPQRNGATLAALRQADVIVAVGAGDPIGLGRLVRGLTELAEVGGDSPAGVTIEADGGELVVRGPTVPSGTDASSGGPVTTVVVNRVRKSVAGPAPEEQIGAALARFAGVRPAAFIPNDPDALDAALAAGQALAEIAPRSPARLAVSEMTRGLLGMHEVRQRRGLARLLG